VWAPWVSWSWAHTLFVNAAATFPAISLAVCFVGLALPPIVCVFKDAGGVSPRCDSA